MNKLLLACKVMFELLEKVVATGYAAVREFVERAMSREPKLPAPRAVSGPPIEGEPGIASLVPFGLDQVKPRHFREALGVLWENRDRLKYASNILKYGVCDGCSLGPRGLSDDVLAGVHNCMSRMRLLRNNTIGAFEASALHNVGELRKLSNRALRELGRVPYPFLYRPGQEGFQRISWAEVSALVASDISEVSPQRLAFFATSKGLTNESYYVLSKAARLLGTNNVDLSARMCHASSATALKSTLGYGAATCSLSDMIGTDLLLLWGTNLANNHPMAIKYLAAAKAAGTRIVVINPVLEKGLESYWIPSQPKSALFGTRLMDDFIQVNLGGDIALMNAVLKLLLSWGAVNEAFISEHTTGWDELVAHLKAQELDGLLNIAGVHYNQAHWLAKLIARSNQMVTVWSMGLSQHRFGTHNIMGLVNLHLSQGALGRERCGLIPLAGHSGVSGGVDCGVSPECFPGDVPICSESASNLEGLWGYEVPWAVGLSVPEVLAGAVEGDIDVLYQVGGNLQVSAPINSVELAFKHIKFRIHQDININTSALLEPAPGGWVLVLPAQTRYEQQGGGTVTSTERRIRFSPEISEHSEVGETKPEWQIPALFAVAVSPELASGLLFESSQAIRDEMAQVMPMYQGIEKLNSEGDWLQWGGPMLYEGGVFEAMAEKRARFSCLEPPSKPNIKGQYVISSRRGGQFNSMVFSLKDEVQGGLTRSDVFMNVADADREGLAPGDRIWLVNEHGKMRGVVRHELIPRGHLQVYWPEGNALLSPALDPKSKQPDYTARATLERA